MMDIHLLMLMVRNYSCNISCCMTNWVAYHWETSCSSRSCDGGSGWITSSYRFYLYITSISTVMTLSICRLHKCFKWHLVKACFKFELGAFFCFHSYEKNRHQPTKTTAPAVLLQTSSNDLTTFCSTDKTLADRCCWCGLEVKKVRNFLIFFSFMLFT